MTREREQLLRAAENGALSARDMQSRDLVSILAIEHNAQPSPWSRLSFEESMTKGYRCRVIESHNGVNAESIWAVKEIVAYHVVCEIVEELHILNVVAAPQYQGLGLGHMLMADILEFAETRHLSKLFLEVRVSNQVAQSLYLKWQFRQIAMRKQYYRPNSVTEVREDALVFLRQL